MITISLIVAGAVLFAWLVNQISRAMRVLRPDRNGMYTVSADFSRWI